MRIVFVDRGGFRDRPGEGGTSDTIWNMASQFAKMGDDVYMLGPYTVNDYPDDAVKVRIIRAPEWCFRNIVGLTIMLVLAWWQSRDIPNVDVFHMRDYLAAGVFSALSRRVPVVLTVPGNVYQREALGIAYYDRITKIFFKLAARISAKHCAHIIATSQEMRDWWLYTGTNPLHISTIPLGVRSDIFHPVEDARAKLGWDPAARVVLFVGRLVTHIKGLDTLLNAMSIVTDIEPTAELHILGDGPDRQSLAEMAKSLNLADEVFIHGWRPIEELPGYYSAADLSVLTSNTEPFGRTMLESMACGTPFLGPPIGGIADHIADGINGFLAASMSPEALARKIVGVFRDITAARTIGKQGRAYVLDNLTWEVVAHRMRQEVFEKVVSSEL